MPLHAVLLDLDRTLFDKDSALRGFAHAQFVEHLEAVRPLWRDEWVQQFTELHGRLLPKPQVYQALQAHFGLTSSLTQRLAADFDAGFPLTAAAVPGALALLARLRDAGLKTAIVTNGRDHFQRAKIAALGATRLVDAIVTSGAFGVKKPDPAIFGEALRLLRTAAGDAAVVGDNPEHDLRPARLMGLRTVHKTCSSIGADPAADFASDSLWRIGDFLLEVRESTAGAASTRPRALR